jgi:HEAT repeat protein
MLEQEAIAVMDADPLLPQVKQPVLFSWGETSFGALELYPEVWAAAEALTSPDVNVRRLGVERLAKLGAARLSPLVSYLLATRLTEPDIEVRSRIIQTLSEVLEIDAQGDPAPELVRQALSIYLARFRTREIYALLQATIEQPPLEAVVARLLRACPYAGGHLADILSERKFPLPIRRQATRMLGRVGYIDAIPALTRVAARLETRLSGQQVMPFLSTSGSDDTALLPDIREALAALLSHNVPTQQVILSKAMETNQLPAHQLPL